MFFSLMLIFMCCVNTDERLFLFTRKKPNGFFFTMRTRAVKYRIVNTIGKFVFLILEMVYIHSKNGRNVIFVVKKGLIVVNGPLFDTK